MQGIQGMKEKREKRKSKDEGRWTQAVESEAPPAASRRLVVRLEVANSG
jgi:hypothetical protein